MLDKNSDKRIGRDEFEEGHKLLGLESAKGAFDKIDTNGGGYILFDEFCTFMAKKQLD